MLQLTMMFQNLASRLREEDGQGLAEYGLILVFVAVIAIGALTFLGGDISDILSRIATKI